MYGKRLDGIYDVTQHYDAQTQIEVILEAFHSFIDVQNDDVTILVIKAK